MLVHKLNYVSSSWEKCIIDSALLARRHLSKRQLPSAVLGCSKPFKISWLIPCHACLGIEVTIFWTSMCLMAEFRRLQSIWTRHLQSACLQENTSLEALKQAYPLQCLCVPLSAGTNVCIKSTSNRLTFFPPSSPSLCMRGVLLIKFRN